MTTRNSPVDVDYTTSSTVVDQTSYSGAILHGSAVSTLVPLNLASVRKQDVGRLSEASSVHVPCVPQRVPPSSTVTRNLDNKMVMAIKRDRHRHLTVDHSDSSDLTGDESVSGDEWSSGSSAKVSRGDVAVDYSLGSSGQTSSESSTGHSVQKPANKPRRHTGPRKPRVYEKLTPEEEERRRMRRERNKFAAAKCRQKRVDLTNELLAETEKLESEQAKIQESIKTYQREKEELEFILEAHRLHCGVSRTSTSVTAPPASVTSSVLALSPSDGKFLMVVPSGPATVPSAESSTTVLPQIKQKSTVARRPNSLLPSRLAASSAVAGVAITTPSTGLNVFTLGLESMLDGHTGLTPITGLPVALTGLSTPVFAIPASVSSVAVEETVTTTTLKTESPSSAASASQMSSK